MKTHLVLVALLLAGCSQSPLDLLKPGGSASGESAGPARSGSAAAPEPPATARTVDEFDTTSAEERAAAAAPAQGGGGALLGTSVASLGDPARPGFWLETPLVSAETQGRVAYGGKWAQVTLIPIDGPATGGSRISLAAMRLLGAPLTDLPTVEVYSGG